MLKAEGDLRREAAEPRDPVRTRQRLLQAAFQEVYHSGFQGSDLETILDRAGVTKGALYRQSFKRRVQSGMCNATSSRHLARGEQFCYALFFRLCSQLKPAMPNA